MAVNYAEKFSQTIDEQLSKDSLTDKAVNKDYDFDGVNKVNVYSVETVPLNDYDINAKSNRYGTPVELGNDVQTLELTQDKSFTFSIDRKNATDTMMAMSAAKALARELKEVVTPTIDRYRIAKYTAEALVAHTKEETLTTETAYSAFLEGSMVLNPPPKWPPKMSPNCEKMSSIENPPPPKPPKPPAPPPAAPLIPAWPNWS